MRVSTALAGPTGLTGRPCFARARRCLVAACLPLLAWSFSAPSAFAQDADIAQARQLGQQAQAAYDAGNYAESEKLWAAAGKLYSAAPTLTLGLARTQAKLGKLVAAQESYNRIIREWSNHASPPPAFKDALEAAKTEVGPVSARVASVVITVDGPPSPSVTIDGQSVNAAALGLKRPVDPGPHTVKASADGFSSVEQPFQVVAGGAAEVKLKMDKTGAAPVAAVIKPAPASASSDQPAPEGPPKKSGSSKTLVFVAFGVGGAGLVVGAVTGLIAVGKHGDLKKQCTGGTCPTSEQSNVDSYKTMGTISTIGFIVAGVGGVAGAVLLLTAPKEATASAGSHFATVKTKGLTMTPYLGGTSAGLTGSF
jgi:hypothetical protein